MPSRVGCLASPFRQSGPGVVAGDIRSPGSGRQGGLTWVTGQLRQRERGNRPRPAPVEILSSAALRARRPGTRRRREDFNSAKLPEASAPYRYQWRNIPPKASLKPPGGLALGGNGYLATYKTRREPFRETQEGLLSPFHTTLNPRYCCKIQNKLANQGRTQPQAWCFRIKRPLSRAISWPSSRVAPPKGTRIPPERVHTSNEDLAGDPIGWHWAKFRRPTDLLTHVDHPRMAVINQQGATRGVTPREYDQLRSTEFQCNTNMIRRMNAAQHPPRSAAAIRD